MEMPKTAELQGEELNLYFQDVRYITGRPLNVRADANKGKFNYNGEETIGDEITIHPVAFRYFKGNTFDMGEKQWIEIFYINQDKALCCVSFHDYSVENFISEFQQIVARNYYKTGEKKIRPINVVIRIGWEKKEKSLPNGDKATYYIAKFKAVKVVSDSQIQPIFDFGQKNAIYRSDTRVKAICERVINYRAEEESYSILGEEVSQDTEVTKDGEIIDKKRAELPEKNQDALSKTQGQGFTDQQEVRHENNVQVKQEDEQDDLPY